MRSKYAMVVVATLALVLVLAACGAPKVDWTLSVSGAVSSPHSWTYADLAGLPETQLEDILMERSTGEDSMGSWSGVPIQDLLDAAGAGDLASVTAVAADGYAIEITKDELEGGIVALKENGEWIANADPEHGPIRLVTPNTPASRWVFQLQEIQVNEVPSGPIPPNAAVKITGNVEEEMGWSADKLRSFDTTNADYTSKDGTTTTYTGVAFNDLLDKATPASGATTVVLIASDDYSAEVDLAEVLACADCIVAFSDDGTFRTVMPGMPGAAQVKDVVEIQVH